MRALALGALVCVPASAQAMTVAQFLAKARGLQALGPLAMASPDLAQVRGEMNAIVAVYRADLAAARKAGRAPHSCPPAPELVRASWSNERFLAELETISPTRRGASMRAAFYAIMRKHYPCRG